MTGLLDSDQRRPLKSSVIGLLILGDKICKDFCKEERAGAKFLHKKQKLGGFKARKGGQVLAVWWVKTECFVVKLERYVEGAGPTGPCWQWKDFGFLP